MCFSLYEVLAEQTVYYGEDRRVCLMVPRPPQKIAAVT